MMPLGGHAVVLCLLLLAVVHRCILMDTSNNEVSFWQCSKEPVSLTQWDKRIDGAHHKRWEPSFNELVCPPARVQHWICSILPAKHFLSVLPESGSGLKFSGIECVWFFFGGLLLFHFNIQFPQKLVFMIIFYGFSVYFVKYLYSSFLFFLSSLASFKQVQFIVLVNTVYYLPGGVMHR